jgi:S1-C subfamily serine protease
MNRFLSYFRNTTMIFSWFLILTSPGSSYSQNANQARLKDAEENIVIIKAFKHGQVSETGAGIIVKHFSRGVRLIITAYHVIKEADSVKVKFYDDRTITNKAIVFDRYDEKKDFAVITVPNIQNLKKLKPLEIVSDTTVRELDKVFAIGHPFGREWYKSSAEIRKSDDILHFSFSQQSIHSGNSGGGLFNDQFQLIGLIIHKRASGGGAIKIKYAVEMLEEWGLPCNFVLSRRRQTLIQTTESNKKWWILGTGAVVSTAAIVIYFVFKDKKELKLPNSLPGPPNPPSKFNE